MGLGVNEAVILDLTDRRQSPERRAGTVGAVGRCLVFTIPGLLKKRTSI